MDTDTCVAFVSRGPNEGKRCAREGIHPLGVGDFKVCSTHHSVLFTYATRHYPFPVWLQSLINKGLRGRYDHA